MDLKFILIRSLFLSVLLFSNSVFAKVVWMDESVDVEVDMGKLKVKLQTEVERHIIGQAFTEADLDEPYFFVIPVKRLPGAYFVITYFQEQMNLAFGRAALHFNGGPKLPAGVVYEQQSIGTNLSRRLIKGHNFPDSELDSFFDKVKLSTDPQMAMNRYEKEIYENVIKPIKEKGLPFYIVGWSIQNVWPYEVVLSHEILHAQMDLREGYSKTVEIWWDSLSDDLKAAITAALAKKYDVSNRRTLLQEAQAFLLQPGAENLILAEFVPTCRQVLNAMLIDAGEAPIIVK